MRILWIWHEFVAFSCICLPASKWFLFSFQLLCVSLCCPCLWVCLCVCYQKNGLMVVCSLSARSTHTHTYTPTQNAGGVPAHIWGSQVASLSTHTHTHTSYPRLSLLQSRFGSFVHSLLSSGFIVNVFRKLFSLDSANKMAEFAVCPLTICLPVCLSVSPLYTYPSFSLSHTRSRWPSFVSCWHFVWHSPG